MKNILLVQLPIPPPGIEPVEGNVPLASAYLKLYARRCGWEQNFNIDILPAPLANTLGDAGLIEEILARRPSLVGFSCYLWNIERTLWIAGQLKQRQPDLRILVGGPEITPDNQWVLRQSAVDYAIVGEGELTFVELLAHLAGNAARPPATIVMGSAAAGDSFVLDDVSSPYLEGILDLAAGQSLLFETARGCRYGCKYCYYPKSHHVPRFLSAEQIAAHLQYADRHQAGEVVLLDPTLNQRPHFADFLRLLAKNNPRRQFTLSGELRAEGINKETASLLQKANFHEVEIGLQSVEPETWRRMGRPGNLARFVEGVHAMLDEGIKVQVDLILGLPGDSADSFRRGIDFLLQTHAYTQVQVFNLAILPGTAFRQEAEQLGLKHQPWPPYYALQTPTLDVEQMFQLMAEAQDAFGIEFDPLPTPRRACLEDENHPHRSCRIDLDLMEDQCVDALPDTPALSFALWLRSSDFHQHRHRAAALVERVLTDNPYITLQVILEPVGDPNQLRIETLSQLLASCYRTTTYLDRYYSLHPGQLLGAKRLFVSLRPDQYARVDDTWLDQIADYATVLQ